MTENMYRVELAWRYTPPAPRRPYYATSTFVVMAEDGDEAVRLAADKLSKNGDVTNIRGKATIRWRIAMTDLPKRCSAAEARDLPLEVTR